jgi:ribosomal protein S6--L-glutamate ligase|tara:strand:+ start:375 stop:1409 length:1035 start_codon:yes stop_codon:yes gene_type:complete
MEKFKSFITEAKEEPYRILVLMRDVENDPNKTGDALEKQAKKMGIDLYQMEVDSGYFTTNKKGNLVAHNYKNFKPVSPTSEWGDPVITDDKKGWEITPEDTLCILRVALGRGIRYAEQLRLAGVKTVNSRETNLLCDDKWLNYLAMKNAGLQQPRTAILTHEENIDIPIKEIGGKYPMILKTAQGTQGVGVIFIDSRKTLLATMQLINKIDEDIAMLIQEYIKTDYDVRVMVLNNEIVGQLKRPIVTGDFRSNVSQGSLPLKMKLTELEKSETLKAAKSVNGIWLGVDFIPSKDREKIPPYLIEVNSSPGTGHIDELNGTDIYKMILDTFKNRDNWTLDNSTQS